jgi:hypothetical protein
MSDSPEANSPQQKLEELMERVRRMPPGGDLMRLLLGEVAELNQLIQEQALAQREAVSKEADFSPSDQPPQ